MYEDQRSAATSTDLIASARMPSMSNLLGMGIAVIALSFAASSALAAASDAPPAPANPASPHAMTVEDIDHLLEVDSPQLSPDGQWIAYTVRRVDTKADKNITDLWMASWDG